jgi:hypothetical protein
VSSDALRAAYEAQDWAEVLRRAPADPNGDLALLIGHAHWFLGDVGSAIRWLEVGFADASAATEEATPFRYVLGMAHLLTGNLPAARRHLEAGLGASPWDPWRFRVLRGLAQVEMELGLLDAADHRLRHLPDDPSGQRLQHVMRAKAAFRAGTSDAARANLWIALRHVVGGSPERDDPWGLVDEASLLVAGAEILAGMGHGAECHRVLDAAEARLTAAARPGLPIENHLRLFRAMGFRLTGDPSAAEELLDMVADRAGAADEPDVLATVARERARIAHGRGDAVTARDLWESAVSQFEDIGYVWEAEATRREAADGPVTDEASAPLEDWFSEDAPLYEAPPSGVVVSVLLPEGDEGAVERMLDLTETLTERLASATEGFVDGWGTDGEEFEVYAYGDEPDRLWSAMEEPVFALGYDGTVRLEWGRRFSLLLLDPPADLVGLKRVRALLPHLPPGEAASPPLSISELVIRLALTTDDPDPPLPEDLELLRSARLEWSKIWVWLWRTPTLDRYVTATVTPGVPLVVEAYPEDGLSPEQHLLSLRYGYRWQRPDHLW